MRCWLHKHSGWGKRGTSQQGLHLPGEMDSSLNFMNRYHIARNGYIIQDGHCKMKMWGPLFKNYKNFSKGMAVHLTKHRTLLRAWVAHSRSQACILIANSDSPDHYTQYRKRVTKWTHFVFIHAKQGQLQAKLWGRSSFNPTPQKKSTSWNRSQFEKKKKRTLILFLGKISIASMIQEKKLNAIAEI